ncbi:MAG: WD40 repeat domain-containing protein [bacterium]
MQPASAPAAVKSVPPAAAVPNAEKHDVQHELGAENTKPREDGLIDGDDGLHFSTSALEQLEADAVALKGPGVFDVAAATLVPPSPPQTGIIRRKKKSEQLVYELAATIRTTHQHVYAVSLSADNALLATAGGDDHVCVWRTDGSLVHRFKVADAGVNSLKFSSDGSMLAAGGDTGVLHLWLLAGGTGSIRHAQLTGHRSIVSGVAFTSDSRYVVSSSFDGTARIWSLERGESLHTLEGHEGPVTAVSCSPGRTITVGHDGTVRVWNGQWMQVDLFDGFDALNAGSTIGVMTVWGAANGEVFRDDGGYPRPLLPHRGQVRSVVVAPNGTIATTGDDQRVMIYSRESGEPAQSLKLPSGCWSLDVVGTHIAAGCDDGAVYLYRMT